MKSQIAVGPKSIISSGIWQCVSHRLKVVMLNNYIPIPAIIINLALLNRIGETDVVRDSTMVKNAKSGTVVLTIGVPTVGLGAIML